VSDKPTGAVDFRSIGPSVLNPWWVLLAAFGFAPLLALFFFDLWQQPEYQFFPYAIAAAVFFARTRSREVPLPLESGHPALTVALVAASLAALALGLAIWSPWLGAVAALVAGVSWAWWRGGWPMLRALVPTFAMLAVIIPPPLGLEVQFGIFLRSVATTLSSRALHLLEVRHTVEGHVIALPGQRLLVEEACSGINSLMFIAAFGLFFLFWQRRQIWAFFVILPAALMLVVAGNIVRISLGAWLRYHDSLDILTGWKHEWLSIILVVTYIVSVVILERILPGRKTFVPDVQDCVSPSAGQGICRPSLRWAWTAGCAFALLGVFGSYRAWEKSREGIEPLRMAKSSLRNHAEFQMPDRMGDWRRDESVRPTVNKIESLGLSTLTWTYQNQGLMAVVALDYPISGYHDVSGCYENAGWEIESKKHIAAGSDSPERIELEMKRPSGSRAFLWFATMNESGQRVDVANPQRDFFGRFVNLGAARETTYRIQLLIVGTGPLDSARRANAEQLLSRSCEILFPQVLEQLDK